MKVYNEKIRKMKFIGVISILYFFSYFIHFHGSHHDWPTMVDNYYDLTRSIVEEHTLERTKLFYECNEIYKSEKTVPLKCKDAKFSKGRNDKIFARYPPGSSFLAIPIYYVGYILHLPREGKLILLVVLNTIFSILILLYLYLFANLFLNNEKDIKIVVYIAAFTTILWTYSQTFANDVLSTLLIIGGTYHIHQYIHKKRLRDLIISGLLLGYTYAVKPPYILISSVYLIILYLHNKNLKEIIYFGGSTLITFLVGAIYYLYCFGSILKTGYSTTISYETLKVNNLSHFFSVNPIVGIPVVLFLVLLFNPYYIFIIPHTKLLLKKDKILTVLIFCSSSIVLLTLSLWKYVLGGWSFGLRIGMPAVILLYLYIIMVYDKIKHNRFFWAMVVYSFVFHLLGTLQFTLWDYQYLAEKWIRKHIYS